jgi:transcriptional regulator with XRE-family HTH domain
MDINSKIGAKIRKLREGKNMSQNELALELGISQTKLHNIESGFPKKIDCLLIDKVCQYFDKDPSYFLSDNVVNNNVKENTGQISCENFTVNNNYPESILVEIQRLIDENKALKEKVAAMKGG